MKKYLPTLVLTLFTFYCYGQGVPDTTFKMTDDKEWLLKESRQHKMAGFILLAGAFTTGGIGGLIMVRDTKELITEGKYRHLGATVALTVVSLGLTIGGICAIVTSGKRRREAMQISLSNQITYQLQNKNLAKLYVPSISLKLQL